MEFTETFPAGAVLPETRGLAVGCAVLGPIFLVMVVTLSPRPVSAFVSALVFAVLFSICSWLVGRGRQVRMWAAAGRSDRGCFLDPRAAFRRGVTQAFLVTLAEAVVLVLFAWLWGLQDVALLGGTVLAVATLSALSARDLRRWQWENRLEVCRKVGARWLVWTLRQKQSRLVTVPAQGPIESNHLHQ